jgi:L-lactate dehydrogenase complex protein LldG
MESARQEILRKIRAGLNRKADQLPPPVRLRPKPSSIDVFLGRIEALAGKTYRVDDARHQVESILAGRSAVVSNAPFLREAGIAELPGVQSGFSNREALREICASADAGITCADYALADTGTLVMISSAEEARMISLLPPAHIAVVPANRILSGLDELLLMLPKPADATSSMVLITGPSRTGDIEQILVRGVHGPGEIHVIVV